MFNSADNSLRNRKLKGSKDRGQSGNAIGMRRNIAGDLECIV